MEKEGLRREIQGLEGISSPSGSLDRILELAADCESDIGELTAAIESDPAVTSKVLRLSNSAYFGVSGKIETVNRAALVIGYKNVLSLATCAALAPMIIGEDPWVDRSLLWLHSCATAEASRLVGARTSLDPSVAYVAGLLHDLGVVVLSEVVGDRYGRVIDASQRSDLPLAEIERKHLGVDHPWAAGVLFEQWTLPERLVTAVTLHHMPREDPTGFAAAVALADRLAAAAGFASPGGQLPKEPPPSDILDLVSLKDADFEALGDELEERRGAIEISAGAGQR